MVTELYTRLVHNYDVWTSSHYAANHGCLWQYADRDGQENSIGGDGCRPLINAAMVGEARALASIAAIASDAHGGRRFAVAKARWQRALLSLWDASLRFFVTRAVDKPESVPPNKWSEKQAQRNRELNDGRCPPRWATGQLVTSRELQGLSSPWYFGAVPMGNASTYAAAWGRLFDDDGFAAKWGPRTAERRDPCYNFTTNHECSWNGPTWPFETSKVLTGALNLLHDYPSNTGGIDATNLWTLISQYARLHSHTSAVNASDWLLDGVGHAWIGEDLHPDDGFWLARAIMYAAGNSGRNRGHRYLHSTFVDVVVGFLGVRPRSDRTLVVQPLLPADQLGVRYFALDGLRIKGRDVCVAFDRDGTRYKLNASPGNDLHVLVDSVLTASGTLGGTPLVVTL